MQARHYYWRWFKKVVWSAPTAIDLWTGAVGAVFGVIDHYWPTAHLMEALGWQIAIWAFGAVLVVRLFMAPFLMAQDDAEKITKLEAEKGNKELRNRAKGLLGRYFAKGHALYPPHSSASPNPGAEAWMDDTQALINEMFGVGESSLFLSNAGYTFLGGGKHYNRLDGRLRRLSSLIERFEHLSLAVSFNPEKWETRLVERKIPQP